MPNLLDYQNQFFDIYTDVASKMALAQAGKYNPYREFNSIVNSIFFTYTGLQGVSDSAYSKLGDDAGYYVACYVRDLALGTCVYWGTAMVWHFVIYTLLGDRLFTKRGRAFPESAVIVDQMRMAQSSLFIYAGLPIVSEYLIENKLTMAYFYVDEVGGWLNYSIYLCIYIALVEFGIYWMHRTLHTNKMLYKYIHGPHHKYNKPSTLTPWASIAFHPVDGILQASPYAIFLFFVPVHYFTHVFLLFFSGVWATNIHDSTWLDSEPIMGSKYHTIHHTHYHYNFGQFFIFWDWFYGTLRVPELKEVEKSE